MRNQDVRDRSRFHFGEKPRKSEPLSNPVARINHNRTAAALDMEDVDVMLERIRGLAALTNQFLNTFFRRERKSRILSTGAVRN